MAKAKKRWAVRERTGNTYLVFVGRKPRQPLTGWTFRQTGCVSYIPAEAFDALFPTQHLPPGGGPVEIRFADEE